MDTTTQTNKEKQHYVPKFFLKRFSCFNDNKTIGVSNPVAGLYVPRAPLRSQAYGSYFYGRDGILEDELSQVEGITAEALRQASAATKQPAKYSSLYYSLMFHTVLSSFRTAANIQTSQKHLNNTVDIGFAGRPLPLETPLLTVAHEKAVKLAMELLKPSLEACYDLEIKLVKNVTRTPFITCDDPVLRYNQLLEKYSIPAGITGLAHSGLQLFLPIDTETLLIAYDSRHYKLGNKKGNDLIYCAKEDVDKINLMSVLSYDKTVFFNHGVKRDYLFKLSKQSEKFGRANQAVANLYYRVGKKDGEFIYSIDKPADYDRMLVASYISPLKIKLSLSFISFTREAARFIPYRIGGNMRPHCAEIYERERRLHPRGSYKLTYPEKSIAMNN